ncbi:uncharacterized protein TNCT_246021 [Trichonephila clavata]|uniref:Uncharacterized protein n=1 Tax=Trichonephila clavata TaxID=2740835 RepID=A0A8X6L3P4_TRICU|nr:uncharacterized protein TNCT_246021 [Trichonephila clavata]
MESSPGKASKCIKYQGHCNSVLIPFKCRSAILLTLLNKLNIFFLQSYVCFLNQPQNLMILLHIKMIRLLRSLGPMVNSIMPISTSDVIDLLCTLAEEERLKVTLSESLKGGVITGFGAVVGGLLLGPMGFPIGGALGGGVAAVTCGSRFQPVSQVIATMSQERRERLANKIRNIMNKIDVTDVVVFTALISGDFSVRNRVIGALVDYLRHEMSMALVE